MGLFCDSTSNHLRTVRGRRVTGGYPCIRGRSPLLPLLIRGLIILALLYFANTLSPAHKLRQSTMERPMRIVSRFRERLHVRSRSANARLSRSPTPDPEQNDRRPFPPSRPADRSCAAAYPPGYSVVVAPPPADHDSSHPKSDVTEVIA